MQGINCTARIALPNAMATPTARTALPTIGRGVVRVVTTVAIIRRIVSRMVPAGVAATGALWGVTQR